jgi:hypothetical protein
MLGLAGGLVCTALETAAPGSFSGPDLAQAVAPTGQNSDPAVWSLSFVQLNYFAFVSLTTTGYGEILPLTPQAQMLSMALAVSGNMYLTGVLGMLISRYINSHDAQ